MKRLAILASAAVLLNLVVNILHGWAHERLGVDLTPWQQAFVVIVITILPLVAGVLCWTRYAQFGALLLGVSMLASLVFGVYYHFVFESSDHVSHLPPGDSQGFFVLTASLLVPVEILGAGVGFWNWAKLRQGGQ